MLHRVTSEGEGVQRRWRGGQARDRSGSRRLRGGGGRRIGQRRLGDFDEGLEGGVVAHGEVGEDLAVDLDAGGCAARR